MTSLLQYHQRRAADLVLAMLMLRLGTGVHTVKPRQDAIDYRREASPVGGQRMLPGRGW